MDNIYFAKNLKYVTGNTGYRDYITFYVPKTDDYFIRMEELREDSNLYCDDILFILKQDETIVITPKKSYREPKLEDYEERFIKSLGNHSLDTLPKWAKMQAFKALLLTS